MSEQANKITIRESNLAKATKREYSYRLRQFYAFAPISSDDELIDCHTDELQQIPTNYIRYLIGRVNSDIFQLILYLRYFVELDGYSIQTIVRITSNGNQLKHYFQNLSSV